LFKMVWLTFSGCPKDRVSGADDELFLLWFFSPVGTSRPIGLADGWPWVYWFCLWQGDWTGWPMPWIEGVQAYGLLGFGGRFAPCSSLRLVSGGGPSARPFRPGTSRTGVEKRCVAPRRNEARCNRECLNHPIEERERWRGDQGRGGMVRGWDRRWWQGD
jgi:hypothetical protein